MKKLLLVVFAFILMNNVLNAQTTSWQLVGNTLAGTEIFGSISNHSVPFRTNNVERMRILNTGEVGIGTTTPSSRLMVKATTTGEVFRTEAPSANDCYWRMQRNNSGTITDLGQLVTFSGQDNFNIIANRGHLNIRIGNAGTTYPAMRIRGGSSLQGYVGIGDYTTLTTPNALLQLYQHDMTNKRSAFLLNNVHTGSALTDGFLIDIDPSTSEAGVYQQENQNIKFYTGNSGGGTSERFVIGSSSYNGNSGFGGALSDESKVAILATNLPATSAANSNGMLIANYQTNPGNATYNRGINIACTGGQTVVGTDILVQNVLTDAYGVRAVVDNNFCNSNNGGYFSASGTGGLAFGNMVNTGIQSSGTLGDYAIGHLTVGDGGSALSYGLESKGQNSVYVAGVVASGYNGSSENYGVYSTATGTGAKNIGVYGHANGATINYGVWGKVNSQSAACTTGTALCPLAAGYFDGDVYATADVVQSSDIKFKTNIADITNGKSIISQLHPKSYEYDEQGYPSFGFSAGTHYGLIAQEVEQVLPGHVKNMYQPAVLDTNQNVIHPAVDFKGVNYIGIIPFLISAFQEQQQQIDSLLNVLNGVPRSVTSGQDQERRGQNIELKEVASVILNQNDPNPFTESTRITYIIPQSVSDAKVIFTNATGMLINTVKISERGFSELNVFSSELGSGIYTYTLVCDGKIIDSKKMIKQ